MKHHIPHPNDLLAAVQTHMGKASLTKSAFGILAVGDPRFVFDLEAGRECRTKTVQRVCEFIETGRTFQDVKEAEA